MQLARVIAPLLDQPTVIWKSAVLSNQPVTRSARLREIARQVVSNKTLRKELSSLVHEIPKKNSSGIWDCYFTIYDRVVLASSGYEALLKGSNSLLPSEGTLLDLGTGTGNFAVSLLYSSPKRKVIGIDISKDGLALARKKLKLISKGRSRYRLILNSLNKLESFGFKKIDGAVMNNVLYNIPIHQRLTVLKQVWTLLKPNGPFFLCDPFPRKKNVMAPFIAQVAEASSNGARFTEFEFAFLCYLIVGRITRKVKFLTDRELSSLCKKAGFKVMKKERVYYRTCTLLHLRKQE